VYEVKVEGTPDGVALERLKRKAGRCKVVRARLGDNASWFRLTLFEGKFHQVKRLWQHAGHPVVRMNRESFAGVTLSGIRGGQSRPLTRKEIAHLRRTCGLAD